MFLFLKAMERDAARPSVVDVMVGGRCGEPLPMFHTHSIYSVDLATNAVRVWKPN